jgi:hypothetical protein
MGMEIPGLLERILREDAQATARAGGKFPSAAAWYALARRIDRIYYATDRIERRLRRIETEGGGSERANSEAP